MIWRTLLALILAISCDLASGAETVKASGSNATAIGQAQNVIVNNESGQKIQNQHTQFIQVINMADVSKLNALQRHQNALLVAEHPTKVEVTTAEFLPWTSDPELFLTVILRNVSNLPALKVEYGITDQIRNGRSRTVKFLAVAQTARLPKYPVQE